MQKARAHRLRLLLATLALGILSSSAWGQTYQTIYKFQGTGLGYLNGLVRDAAGNLYGAAYGTSGSNCTLGVASSACGVIFELSLGSSGQWGRSIVHTFGGSDGANPSALLLDSKRNLYGTTYSGGANGFGAVFMLTRASSGWTEQILYNYLGGVNPAFGVVVDTLGNVYGMDGGGHYKAGQVFKLTPSSGTWQLSYIYSFGVPDATAPSQLAVDANGNLYGANPHGEYNHNFQGGTIYKLSPGSNGVWTSSILYEFVSNRYVKTAAAGGETIDPSGNLFGFESSYAWYGSGIGPYELLAPSYTQYQGVWPFQNSRYLGVDDYPSSPLTFDSLGNVYGAAQNLSAQTVHYPYDGFVFRNGPSGSASYNFPPLPPAQRTYPCGALAPDGQGNVYGTACDAFNGGSGTVFEVTF